MSLSTQLERLRTHLRIQWLFTGVYTLAIAASCAIASLYAINRVFQPNLEIMGFFALLSIFLGLTFLIWLIGLPLMRRLSLRRLALMVESSKPEVLDRFSTALYLDEKSREITHLGYSPALVQETRNWAENASAQYLEGPSAGGQLKKLGITAALCVMTVAAVALLDWRGFAEFSARYMASLEPSENSLRQVAFALPDNTVVPRGEKGSFQFEAYGVENPDSMEIVAHQGQSAWFNLKPQTSDGVRFRVDTPAIVEPLTYRVLAGNHLSKSATVTPVDPPRTTAFTFTYHPPAYTQLPMQIVESRKGDISALPGTMVDLRLKANNPLKSATLIAPDGSFMEMMVAGSEAFGATMTVMDKAGFAISLNDIYGFESAEAEKFEITLIPDEPPDIALIEPADREDVPADLALRLSGFAADDYGISEASLVYEFDYDSIPHSIALFPRAETSLVALLPVEASAVLSATANPKAKTHKSRFDFAIQWDLTSLNLLPGDELTYWIEAADNDNVSGPHIARSRAKRLRYPSLSEIQDELTGMEDKVLEGMKNVYERTEDLTKRVNEIQSALEEKRKRGEELNWEDTKALEDAKKEYEDIEKELQDMARTAEKVEQKAAEQPSFKPETIEKIQRIGELMNELLTDEMKKTINALQQALDQINQQRDLSRLNTEFDVKDFEEQLDRQVSLLEEAYFERQFQTLEQQAESLLDDMKKLEDLTSRDQQETGLDEEALSERQEELNKQAEDLLKQMDAMAERFKESRPEESQALKEMAETARQEGLEEAMKQAKQKLSQGDRQGAQQNQQSASQCMSNLSGKMKEMGDSLMGGSGLQIDLVKVRRLFDRMLDLSSRQEELVNHIISLETLLDWGGLDKKREIGQQQSLYTDETGRIDSAALELAKENPFFNFDIIGHIRLAGSNMKQALALSVDGEPRLVRHQSDLALKHINLSAALLLDTMEQLQNMASQSSQGSGGMFDALQQMINQQQNLNETTKGMGERLKRPMNAQERMGLQQQIQRMADEQAMIRQEMQKFMQNYGQSPEEKIRDVAEQLEGVGDAMEEAERLIQQRNIDEKLENKQEEIMTRLLDAEKSANEQGFEKERRAEPGKKDYEKRRPDDLADHTEEIKNRIIEARGGAGEEFVLPSYRSRVREYFRKLSEKALESL